MAFRPSKRLFRAAESHSPNLIPMLNLFLVLIPLLITMVVTIKLTVMQLNLPTASKSDDSIEQVGEKKNPNKLDNLIIVLTKSNDILLLGFTKGITPENVFRMGKSENAEKAIKLNEENNSFPLHTLEKYIHKIRKYYNEQHKVHFACDDIVRYGDLVNAMDLCRRNGLSEIDIVEINTIGFKIKE